MEQAPPPNKRARLVGWAASVTDPGLREEALAGARAAGGVVAASASAAAEAKGERPLLLAVAFEHPRDARIRFVEGSHSYFLDGVKVPLSVSGLWAR